MPILPKLRQVVRRSPFLRNTLRRMYRLGQYKTAKLLGKLRQDEYHLLDVNPELIQFTINLEDVTLKRNQVWHFGTASDGDWDLGGQPVQTYNQVYAIARQLCVDNLPHEAINEFQIHLEQIQDGAFLDGCSTRSEYFKRWEKLTRLYEQIQSDGYLTQGKLGSENPLDEIRVQIGRHGQFLLEEGLHRLVIAQLLDLLTIPVLVTRRHTQWAALRQAVLKIVLQRGFIHQPFNHPDLDSLPKFYGNHLKDSSMYGDERWDFILSSLSLKSGTVLDIGSYFGYFPHRLEELGFECLALEPDQENFEVLKLYRDIKGKHFKICNKSLFDLKHYEFDLVMALNIFHHLVKNRQDYDRLIEFLERLNCKFMYFEPDPNLGQNAYKKFDDDEFVRFVLNRSCLQSAQFLGKTREGRNMYLLSIYP